MLKGAELPGITGPDGCPTVVSIVEQDFIPWFLDRMGSLAGRRELARRDAFARRNDLDEARLFQPVHKSFNIVLVEAFCGIEGQPRLDPKKILRAGVTIRRRVEGQPRGWVREGGRILGWRPLPGEALGADPAWDPDPAVRRRVAEGRNKAVLSQAASLASGTQDYQESFAPLFPAPPELCAALGRSLLYGYLPLTSDERSEDDPAPEAPFTAELISERLPVVLWREGRREEMPAGGRAAAPLADTTVTPAQTADPSDALAVVIAAASYLAQEPGLFTPPGNTGAPDPTADLRDLLQSFRVEVSGHSGTRTLYRVLEDVYDLAVRRADDTATLRLPVAWPAFGAAQERRFVDAIQTAMAARWAALSPGQTRYQALDARYEVRAFIRVDRSDCGCPPLTVWTPPTDPIEIIPWYEGGEAPPTVVELPAPTEAFFARLKPNVAFQVPEEIQQFMSGLKLDKLMAGEKPDSRLGWGMICGFSIPILTICAFIVLQIFLVLFHILFWWLPFIRICIPFPKKES